MLSCLQQGQDLHTSGLVLSSCVSVLCDGTWSGRVTPSSNTSVHIMYKSLSIFHFPCTLPSLVSMDYFPFLPICPEDIFPLLGITCLTYLPEESTHHLMSNAKFTFSSVTLWNSLRKFNHSFLCSSRSVDVSFREHRHWIRSFCLSVSPLDYELFKVRNYTVFVLVSDSS